MCSFEKCLIAFMDRELEGNEAIAVEQHVSTCDDCRVRLASYENASRDFAAYYAASAQRPVVVASGNSNLRWVPYIAALAAAIVIALILLPHAHKPAQPATQLAQIEVAAPVVAEPAAVVEPVAAVPLTAKRRTVSRPVVQENKQPPSEPVVQIVIPADAMFPPGAMPDGVAYVASLNYTIDGAVPGYRLQQ